MAEREGLGQRAVLTPPEAWQGVMLTILTDS